MSNISYNTSNAVDQLSCKTFPKDYMGKAITPLCIRMTNHKFDIFDQILKDLFHNMPKKRNKLKIVITY